jgi:Zn-dependent alcohol dehydrogenase
VVLGHEGDRVLERVGKRLKGVRVGDHVCTFELQDMNRTCGFLSLEV